MPITSEELPRSLQRGLQPLYIIYGDAPLLTLEAADTIRAAARNAGYTEREVLTAEGHFDWNSLLYTAQNQSLFSERKLIELRIPNGKPGTEGSKILQHYSQHLPSDIITLISLPRPDKSTLKAKWFTALSQHGLVVTGQDIARAALPGWIAGRLQRQQQQADGPSLEFIADRCEGNLLAAYQEIQKLALLFPPGKLSFEQICDAVLDVARFDIFKLSEAMLQRDIERYQRILSGLKAEGTAEPLILWALTEDIRTLGKLHYAVSQGTSLSQAMKQCRIWSSRQRVMEQALRQTQPAQIEQAIIHAAQLDKIIKGLQPGDSWDQLLQLGLLLMEKPL